MTIAPRFLLLLSFLLCGISPSFAEPNITLEQILDPDLPGVLTSSVEREIEEALKILERVYPKSEWPTDFGSRPAIALHLTSSTPMFQRMAYGVDPTSDAGTAIMQFPGLKGLQIITLFIWDRIQAKMLKYGIHSAAGSRIYLANLIAHEILGNVHRQREYIAQGRLDLLGKAETRLADERNAYKRGVHFVQHALEKSRELGLSHEEVDAFEKIRHHDLKALDYWRGCAADLARAKGAKKK
jgi:hypothetical protein